jgi:bacterial/archaeal transporter family-2 protein
VVAGLAGAAQVAVMSALGDRIGVVGALGFATALTAVISIAIVLVAQRSLGVYTKALHQPWWTLLGGVLGLLIVTAITVGGSRIGVAAVVAILIAGQLVAGVAIDRFGWLGADRIPLNWPRAVGLVLLGVGAALSLKR